MNLRHKLQVLASGPRVFAVFRITDEKCWLVKERQARVGEEYLVSFRPSPEMVHGPLVPGTLEFVTGHYSAPMRNPKRWNFMEYRVLYGGTVTTFLPVTRAFKKGKK